MQLFLVVLILAATTLLSPVSLTRRDPFPDAGSFASWPCFDCSESPIHSGSQSRWLTRHTVQLCNLVDCSEEVRAPYTFGDPPTCDPVPVFKRDYTIICQRHSVRSGEKDVVAWRTVRKFSIDQLLMLLDQPREIGHEISSVQHMMNTGLLDLSLALSSSPVL